ncbi:MAG: hypothetical protein ACK5DD_02240 [Cyclobacteriaceae bacterium]|jgi:hypothetical protein
MKIKNELLLLVLMLLEFGAFAQKRETFDITSFTPPPGWQREATENVVSFVTTNTATGGWCRISVFRSMNSSGNPRTDFDTEWQQLIAGTYTGTVKPLPELTEADGWTSCSGVSAFEFNQQQASLLLTSISGFGRKLSLVVLMNSQEFMAAVESFMGSIDLTKPASSVIQPNAGGGAPMPAVSGKTFTASIAKATTNFNDGWVATIAVDKVIVTRGTVQVYIYFPIAHDDASRGAGRDYFWDSRLPSEFQIIQKQYRDHGEVISSFQAPYVEGVAIHRQTGKRVFLGLVVNSGSGNMFPVLAVAPDEETLRKIFPKAEDKFESDLAAMTSYNRFAVTTQDLFGKWSGGGSTAANYYNAYSGAYAGMGAVAMSDRFEFLANGGYSSRHQGASGMVGSMSTYSQDYKGKATITDWTVTMTNRFKGETTNFNAWFEAVAGGVVLHLQDSQYSGLKFDLVRDR